MSLSRDEVLDGVPFPCGQCLACRINKRRIWTLRLVLERFMHSSSAFITLTYSDDNLPYTLDGLPTVCKRDLQLFIKRLRKKYGQGIRYYAVAEYGEKTSRPHYHCVLFGVDSFALDPYWVQFEGKSGNGRDSNLSTLWPYGIVHVGECERKSIQYVAGYVTKKMTKRDDTRQKEFALMSRKPGIGFGAVEHLCAAYKDVAAVPPRQVRYDGKMWPLGRYLNTKLCDALGYEGSVDSFIAEMREKYKSYRSSNSYSFLEWMVSQDDSAFARLEFKTSLSSRSGL